MASFVRYWAQNRFNQSNETNKQDSFWLFTKFGITKLTVICRFEIAWFFMNHKQKQDALFKHSQLYISTLVGLIHSLLNSEQHLTEPVIERCHSIERQWKSWLDFFPQNTNARTTLPISLSMVKRIVKRLPKSTYMVFGLCPHIILVYSLTLKA